MSILQDLKVFLDVGEDPDEVEKHGDGFGPIHYVVTKAHSNKPDLLVGLVIQGNADVDLTTTARSEITALHLAAKVLIYIQNTTCNVYSVKNQNYPVQIAIIATMY